ncbi:hypothetical protein DSCO28_41290 [Desulfosarcina ovata subsp. sediminis]|uniref:Uncharacterized protein n=1 Tax=Desulfosarcina ovata subsp. sediminis TaxID=885957 RepID=A0A5K7ZTL9_9BACT|nr:hypothetical protein [Desulfosarcina ovata]BBO83563.1 hypothetical protein DSCO28_41290 [Desulfosarcina ovata subsp. sediminis]
MIKKLLVSIVLSFVMVFTASSFAMSPKTDFIGTWTGLQQEGQQFNRITLNIETIAWPDGKTALSEPSMTGWSLSGSVRVEPAMVTMRRAPEPQTVPVTGEFYPAGNMVKLQYILRRNRPIVYGVLSQDKNRMALVFSSGRSGNLVLPVLLTAGTELPESLSPFATSSEDAERLRRDMERTGIQVAAGQTQLDAIRSQIQQVKSELRQARSAGDKEQQKLLKAKIKELRDVYRKENSAQQAIILEQAQKLREQQLDQLRMTNPELADVNQKIMELQKQLVKASNDKDFTNMMMLAKELKSLQRQQKSAMALGRNPAAPLSVAGDSGQCPEHVVAWADELEKNGASNSKFRNLGQLVNLFRPSVFEKHFQATLLSMDAKERRQLGVDLRQHCSGNNNAFSRNGNLPTVATALADEGSQINYVSAAMAGEALDIVGLWSQRTLTTLNGYSHSEDIEVLGDRGDILFKALWPMETKSANDAIASAYNVTIEKEQIAQIDLLADNIDGIDAFTKLSRLPQQKNWKKMKYPAGQKVMMYYQEKTSMVLSRHIDQTFPGAARDMGNPRKALIAGKQWYEQNGTILFLFPDTNAARHFDQTFWVQRDELFRKLSPELKKEIVELKQKSEIQNIASDLSLPMDSQRSGAFKDITAAKTKQIAALETKRYTASAPVAPGPEPFKPGHPGAVYLNALYHQDWKTIAREDRAFAIPLCKMMQPMHNSGIYDMMALLSGGKAQGSDIKRYMQTKMEKASMSTSMAGFFILALEHISPTCLGENPVHIERTEKWDNVVYNGLGAELYRTHHSQTYHYTVARRHRNAFYRLGDPASAESLDFINGMLGQFGVKQGGIRASMSKLSANLHGLRKAMQDLPCDGKVIKRIENALMKKALE